MRKEIILSKISKIEESIPLIEENIPEDFEEFENLGLLKDGIYKRIQYMIENILDICAIINSDLQFIPPGEEDDIINNLVKKEILSQSMGNKIKEFKEFRDIIVHRYGKIDDKLSFELIHENLSDFNKIIEKIKTIIDRY
ncbi:MAG: DUF86 domain-containing protein [Candidatus Methanofastidiosa archaeon]|jgi:uncharacterized protein YutE (UPF0331/DUF86 family)|nr:DUF86 domain-containing protein [Candidatus Methanofastidiosa archaeon]HOM95651.1 DUF86 domain-containing protein [Methanofastidiosum sp.]HPC80928.1 DUF86 domain-containing protein [Methanofastidiosum sp.]HRS26098.1 DUF86 domain-containing protein [Methanofastidiosum sp.]